MQLTLSIFFPIITLSKEDEGEEGGEEEEEDEEEEGEKEEVEVGKAIPFDHKWTNWLLWINGVSVLEEDPHIPSPNLSRQMRDLRH